MKYTPSIAMLMATAVMAKLANRKPPTDEEIAAKNAQIEANTRAIEKAEWEEMQRAPRAYYRRMKKALSKSNDQPTKEQHNAKPD